MKVLDLKIENFRSYKKLQIKINRQVNLFLGRNGEGKTNLLEAVYFIISGHPIRFADLNDLVHKNTSKEPAIVRATIERGQVIDQLSAKIVESRKAHFLNEKRVTNPALKQHYQAVIFTPESLSMIKEGPSERRKILDELWVTINPPAAQVLQEFQKCLASRNRVLKRDQNDGFSERQRRDLLNSLNVSFLPLAVEVTWGRIQAAKQALTFASETYLRLMRDKNVEIVVDYVISQKGTIDWSKNQVYDLLASRLTELQAAEMKAGLSLVGPHKHDVRFLVNGQDARIFCSQGQQRSIALAFKIAQVHLSQKHRGSFPLLLLDDVFSELDSVRREQLLAILKELRAQIFLTSTDDTTSALFAGPDVAVFQVEKGHVTQQDGNCV